MNTLHTQHNGPFAKVLQFETRKDIFWASLALIGICACVYIYCVTVTVRNVVTKRQLVAQAGSIGEQLSTKEFSVINLQNGVTLSYAESLGFSDPKNKVFITPRSVSYVTSSAVQNTL